jgi:molybdopterin converting factor small subunit
VKVKALFFGGLRARLGMGEQSLELPEGSSASDAARVICADLGLEWLAALRLAVNEEMAGPGTLLKDGDELALLPPVSGGKTL